MLKKIENGLMALLVVLALFLICKEVVVRYFVPQYLTDYGLEFTIYFTVWAIFLGGAPLVREGRHVRADILLHLLPPPAQRILEILSLLDRTRLHLRAGLLRLADGAEFHLAR